MLAGIERQVVPPLGTPGRILSCRQLKAPGGKDPSSDLPAREIESPWSVSDQSSKLRRFIPCIFIGLPGFAVKTFLDRDLLTFRGLRSGCLGDTKFDPDRQEMSVGDFGDSGGGGDLGCPVCLRGSFLGAREPRGADRGRYRNQTRLGFADASYRSFAVRHRPCVCPTDWFLRAPHGSDSNAPTRKGPFCVVTSLFDVEDSFDVQYRCKRSAIPWDVRELMERVDLRYASSRPPDVIDRQSL